MKSFNIGGGAGIAKKWSALVAEAEKCDIRCANCHRLRTVLEGHNR